MATGVFELGAGILWVVIVFAAALLFFAWASFGFPIWNSESPAEKLDAEISKIKAQYPSRRVQGETLTFDPKIVRLIQRAPDRDGLEVIPRHPKLEPVFIPQRELVTLKKRVQSDWSEYLADAESMDLDAFADKWRDRKKPERPRIPAYLKPGFFEGLTKGVEMPSVFYGGNTITWAKPKTASVALSVDGQWQTVGVAAGTWFPNAEPISQSPPSERGGLNIGCIHAGWMAAKGKCLICGLPNPEVPL